MGMIRVSRTSGVRPERRGRGRPVGIELVLVDFDDTLVDTSPRFQNARRALFEILAGEGFDPARARHVHHHEVDPEMIARHGLGPFRLEPAFRETYLRLCAAAGRTPDPRVLAECVALTRDVVGPPPCFDGAIEALARLAGERETVVYTQAGDAAYQLACIRAAGVLDILPPDRVRICREKTPAEFRRTLARYGVADPALACMVGNSVRADVNPALSVGAHAILVDVSDPWEFDLVEPVSPDFIRVEHFPAAVDLLLGSGPDRALSSENP